MQIHILIPVRNNLQTTLQCLSLLINQTYNNFDITVVDDGSTDGTPDAIRDQFPNVTLLQGDGSLWWTGAINMALGHVLPKAAETDYVLTLNDDVSFKEDYLENLVFAANQRPDSIIGSVSIDKHNPVNVDAGVYFDWQTRKRHKGVFRTGDNFNDRVSHISGRGALVPVKIFKEVGLYNAGHLPQYGADEELCVRAQKAGYRLCVYYNALLQNDTDISGYKFTPFLKISYKMAKELLFSNKSASQIKTRFNFIYLCCPSKYLIRNIVAEFFNILLILTSIPPFFEVKLLFRPLLKRHFNRMHNRNCPPKANKRE